MHAHSHTLMRARAQTNTHTNKHTHTHSLIQPPTHCTTHPRCPPTKLRTRTRTHTHARAHAPWQVLPEVRTLYRAIVFAVVEDERSFQAHNPSGNFGPFAAALRAESAPSA
jgi:hypothetical protein